MREWSNFSPAGGFLILALLLAGEQPTVAQSPSVDATASVRSALRVRLGYPPLPYAIDRTDDQTSESGPTDRKSVV